MKFEFIPLVGLLLIALIQMSNSNPNLKSTKTDLERIKQLETKIESLERKYNVSNKKWWHRIRRNNYDV